jgi:hypothetical protein
VIGPTALAIVVLWPAAENDGRWRAKASVHDCLGRPTDETV